MTTLRRTLCTALICSAFVAPSLTAAERVGTQYFYGYQGEFQNGSWGIIDDLDLRMLRMYEEDVDNGDLGDGGLLTAAQEAAVESHLDELLQDSSMLPDKLKSLYVAGDDDGELTADKRILFDVQWTRKTARRLAQYFQGLDDSEWKALPKSDKKMYLRDARDRCDARLEIGHAFDTYKIRNPNNANAPAAGFAAELDTDLDAGGTDPGCPSRGDLKGAGLGSEAATVRIRTFIPTVPGRKYALAVKYQKRDYNFEKQGAPSEEKAFRDLVVKVRGLDYFGDTDGIDPYHFPLPMAYQDDGGEIKAVIPTEGGGTKLVKLEEGFVKTWNTFVADRHYTPITLRDNGYPDSFGILIRGLHVEEKEAGPNEEICEDFKHNKRAYKKCLLGDPQDVGDLDACDLANGQISYKVGTKGAAPDANRQDVANLTNMAGNTPNTVNFLSLGQGGSVKVRLGDEIMQGMFLKGSCPLEGKSLALQEITWGPSKTFEQYPEKGFAKIKLKGCHTESMNGWGPVTWDHVGGNHIITNDMLTQTFGSDYAGCRLVAVQIKDRTHKLKGDDKNPGSDGIDINSLKLVETP
ncbi:HMG-box domain-containing protein [Ferrimonas marina]|uniref:Uncharacterized protein n=1 Tax=Ferrimonas marina TaxID=299255 RepID=A0A1M5VM33_9GAMM|nr:hypothetical protein [Ferrimonas marina]SHH76312.1 hypothetical protein SAMN02745129_2853 [Ferrimonas marina]